jgi:hypothetical protein
MHKNVRTGVKKLNTQLLGPLGKYFNMTDLGIVDESAGLARLHIRILFARLSLLPAKKIVNKKTLGSLIDESSSHAQFAYRARMYILMQ